MAWDSSRPVPWTRLMREWVIYALVMSVVFVVFFSDRNVIGALAGLLISGPLYLLLGATLAKFGYQRKTIKELRAERRSGAVAPDGADAADDPGARRPTRDRPPPTRRTAGSSPHRPKPKRKR